MIAVSPWPPWVVMWALAFLIYGACKWLTLVTSPIARVSSDRQAAYLLLWPGLDAAAFLREPVKKRPRRSEWVRGVTCLAIGLILFFGIARLFLARNAYLTGWLGMIGFVLILHFGAFQLLSCAWRDAGVQARPLMNKPIVSTSLGEFWGRRWNTAFRDLTHGLLFRPLTNRFGRRSGLLAAFVFSGVIHELVISAPAGAGYGGPTLFFTLQGGGILLERSRGGRQTGLGRGTTGRLFTILMLVLPAPILFHPPFITQVVIPFMSAIGAL